MTPDDEITVLVVDDERLVRVGLRAVLDAASGLRVTGEAADGAEAVALARSLRPDVAVVDVRMPRVDGIEATRRLARLNPAPAVLILTTFDLDEYVHAGLRAGAAGFLLKDAPEDRLVAAVRTVHSGAALLDPRVTLRLVERLTPPVPVHAPSLQRLTPREAEVLRAVATGASNEHVAERLGISEATVKTHVSRILAKLNLVTRVQAVVLAYDAGLVRARTTDGGPSA
jgi:DNA-binding NarL/FixJ family response regulator